MRVLKHQAGFLATAALLGTAFLFPEQATGMLLGWCAALTLAWATWDRPRCATGFVLFIVCGMSIGFYWLPDTLTFFGGFPYWISCLLAGLFFLVSSIQFLFVAWLYRQLLEAGWNRARLALPVAWVVGEFLFPRLFPWSFADTQIVWTSFASLAELSGPIPLSGLLLWWAVLSVGLVRERKLGGPAVGAALVVSVALVGLGAYRTSQIREVLDTVPSLNVGLVQGNLSARQNGEVKAFDVNLETYRTLSRKVTLAGAEIVFWPESAAMYWTPDDIKLFRGTRFDPAPEFPVPLLFGGLSFAERSAEELEALSDKAFGGLDEDLRKRLRYRSYNTAFGRAKGGAVIGRYHKRSLMAFGEYIPFAEYVPDIYKLSPHTGMFDVGKIVEPMVFEVGSDDDRRRLSLMPLICYEDLVPALSIDAARRGAELLVNLTNDVWYGDTAAPHQHHVLAMWRAIETRRYLVRVTNTGLTGVVNPLGESIAKLDVFSEGTLNVDVHPLGLPTVYLIVGDTVLWAFSILVLGIVGFRRFFVVRKVS